MNFKNFFSRKPKEPEYAPVTDFSGVVTDIHSHLIPGIDDGVQTIEESIEMIRGLYELGFRKLITTPHIMSDHYRNTPELIFEGLEKVRAAITRVNLPVTLEAAGEYYLDENLLKKISNEKLLTIGSNYLLFEISYMNAPDNLQQVIFEMNLQGYRPLLAHPERYPFWYQNFDEYRKLKEQGVLLQVNIGSIEGYYGIAPKKIAERMIDEDLVDFIGSDLHGSRHLDAMRRVLKNNQFWKLLSKGVKNSGL